MAEKIAVTPAGDDGSQLAFAVRIGEREFAVTVMKDYHQKLTGGNAAPETLVRKSFEFLLEREPVGSILPEFDLPLIGRYFPEYEEVMKRLARQ